MGTNAAMTTAEKIVWCILMVGLGGVLYLAFRGYLAPAFLLDFANTMLCRPSSFGAYSDPETARSAAFTVFSISIATVIGPTPPGTGVR